MNLGKKATKPWAPWSFELKGGRFGATHGGVGPLSLEVPEGPRAANTCSPQCVSASHSVGCPLKPPLRVGSFGGCRATMVLFSSLFFSSNRGLLTLSSLEIGQLQQAPKHQLLFKIRILLNLVALDASFGELCLWLGQGTIRDDC